MYNLLQDIHGQVQQLQRLLDSLLFPFRPMLPRLGCCGCADSTGLRRMARPDIIGLPLRRARVRIVRRGRERLSNVLLKGQRGRGPGTTGSGERRSHVAVVELGSCHGRQRVERPSGNGCQATFTSAAAKLVQCCEGRMPASCLVVVRPMANDRLRPSGVARISTNAFPPTVS